MAKQIVCADLGFRCDAVARADTEAELLKIVAAHAESKHGISDLTDEVVGKVRAAIREV